MAPPVGVRVYERRTFTARFLGLSFEIQIGKIRLFLAQLKGKRISGERCFFKFFRLRVRLRGWRRSCTTCVSRRAASDAAGLGAAVYRRVVGRRGSSPTSFRERVEKLRARVRNTSFPVE